MAESKAFDFINNIYEYGENGTPVKNLIFERGVASFFDSGKDFGSGEARLRKIKAYFAKCLVKSRLLPQRFLNKKVGNASLQYDKSKQLFLGSCVYNHSVDSSCNGVNFIKRHNGKAVKVINNMLIHPSVWKHSYSKNFLKKITESIYNQKTGNIDFTMTVLSENNRKQLANQAYQRHLVLSNPEKRVITGSNKVVVDIAPQISKKTKKYEPEQVYLSFSDITDQCRTGRVQINLVNIKNIYYLKYDDLEGKTFMILMDITRESSENGPNSYIMVNFKKRLINNGNIVQSDDNKETGYEIFSDFHNGVIDIFTFINTVMSQSSKKRWCENTYAVLSNINPDLFEDIEDLAEGVEAYMEGYKHSIDTFWLFLRMFSELMPYEDIPTTTLSPDQKKINGEFLIACLLKLKEMGDFLYIVEGANYMIKGAGETKSEEINKSVTIITSDKGLVVSKLLFPTQQQISLANYSFAPGGKQKLGIKLKKTRENKQVSTLLKYDQIEQTGGGNPVDYEKCIDYLINEIEKDKEYEEGTKEESKQEKYSSTFYGELSNFYSRVPYDFVEHVLNKWQYDCKHIGNDAPKSIVSIKNIFSNAIDNVQQPVISRNEPRAKISDNFYFSVPDEIIDLFDEKLTQSGKNNIDNAVEIIKNIYEDVFGESEEESENVGASKSDGMGAILTDVIPGSKESTQATQPSVGTSSPESTKQGSPSSQEKTLPKASRSSGLGKRTRGEAQLDKGEGQGQRQDNVKRALSVELEKAARAQAQAQADRSQEMGASKTGGNKRRPKKSRKKSKRKKKTRRKKR